MDRPSLLNLPVESLSYLTSFLDSASLLRLSSTCRRLHAVESRQDSLYDERVRREFAVALGQTPTTTAITARNFYARVMRPYGKCLGLWQRHREHYGGLLQVVYDDWQLRFIEWKAARSSGPDHDNVNDPLQAKDFLIIKLNADAEYEKAVFKFPGLDLETDSLVFPELTTGEETFSVDIRNRKQLQPKLRSGERENSSVVSLLRRLVNDDSDSSDDEEEGENEIDEGEVENEIVEGEAENKIDEEEAENEIDDEEEAENEIDDEEEAENGIYDEVENEIDEGVIKFSRLALPTSSSAHDVPFEPGLFKGTYGGHGIEIIKLHYPDENSVEGYKVTGDPNVPATKITFRANLNDTLVLTREQQRSVDDLTGLTPAAATAAGGEASETTTTLQPFAVPQDCYERSSFEQYRFCTKRYLSEAQVALSGYENPSFIEAHLIVFDADSLAVLFHKLRSITMLKRVTEKLHVIHAAEL